MPSLSAASPPERGRAAPLPPPERRAAILEAALPVLAEFGTRVTTKRLAESAGVSEGTIFNVFADKEELIDAVVEVALDPEPLELAIATIDASLAFEDRLERATALVQRRSIEVWRLFSALGPRPHRLPHALPESAGLARIFADAPGRLRVEPAEAARRLRAMTITLTHPLMTPVPATPAEIVDAFLYGVAARPEPRP